MYWNEDCISGARKHLPDNSIDLILCDPPYGIDGDKLDKHYNRDESNVIGGYVEVPQAKYAEFSQKWISEAERVLRPGGSLYVVSGYTNLRDILNALAKTALQEVNHIIWKYNFGVYTSKKYVSSHYHILYYAKKGDERTFNTFAFFSDSELAANGGKANYQDREDVWTINREYQPAQIKNKNQLPTALLRKIIMYSSNENDMVCDFFLGSFSTAKAAIALGRRACGFELNKAAFDYQIKEIEKIKTGEMLATMNRPTENKLKNRGKKISPEESVRILNDFNDMIDSGATKKAAIEKVGEKYGRGYWSVLNILKANEMRTEHGGGLFSGITRQSSLT